MSGGRLIGQLECPVLTWKATPVHRNMRNVLIAAAIFVVAAALGVGNWRILPAAGAPLFVFLFGIGFMAMGAYSLVARRVYGRTWDKYWGGWVTPSENPGYYWGYTAMYIIGGLLLLFGCRALGS